MRCQMTFQVASVTKPLLAVDSLTRNGMEVVFTKSGGTIVDKASKKTIQFHRRGGVYVLEILVPPAARKDEVQKIKRTPKPPSAASARATHGSANGSSPASPASAGSAKRVRFPGFHRPGP